MSNVVDSKDHIYSYSRVQFLDYELDEINYGFLMLFKDNTIGSLSYVVDSMVYLIFDNKEK